MARKVLIEGYGYTFNPALRTVTIQKFIPEERLILITNVSKNKVIYNFSDPSLGYTNYATAFDPTTGNEQTVVTLVYDTTSGMEAPNQLQILIDEDSQLITPSQTYMDSTNKMRVTQPQALIDTDFEYGTQYSKWETQGLIGNRPYFFPSATVVPNISSIVQGLSLKLVTVTTSAAHNLIVGTPLVVLDTYFGPSNGNFVVESTPSATTFTFTSRAVNNTQTTDLLDPNKTALYQGSIFSNAQIGIAPSAITYDNTTGSVAVTTSIPHGLAIGNEIAMIGTAGQSGGSINGNFVVNQINSATQFTYHSTNGLTGTLRGAATAISVVATNAATVNATAAGVTNQVTISVYSTGNSSELQVGQNISGTNIPAGTVINNIAQIGTNFTITNVTASGSVATFTTGANHNYIAGQVVTISGVNPGAYNITGFIATLPALNQFTINTSATGSFVSSGLVNPQATLTLSNVTSGPLSGTTVNIFAAVYVRPQAQTVHRPFDGGVLFSNNSLSNFSTNIRQSRRYFRYQSGKGLLMSSGTILKPYSGLDQITSGHSITNVTANTGTVTVTAPFHNFIPGQSVTITGVNPIGYNFTGTIVTVSNIGLSTAQFTITNAATGSYVSGGYAGSQTFTIQTKERHNLVPGTSVSISGSTDNAYNGTYAVGQILGWNRYQVTTTGSIPALSPAPGAPAISVNSWSGCVTRLGMFDNQNGVFFEFDGTTLNAVRRSSTFQIAGKVTVAFGSSYVEQTDSTFATQFASQLNPGDFIVMRGFSYRVTDVLSNTQILISPQYRGSNAQFVTASKTVDTRVPQSLWNLDRMDGTGNSGYVVDLAKMQMFYVDYTWYGAGFIRWGLRGVKGDVTYAHKMPNNNVNTEAYMRSGNLPARYEINNQAPITVLSGSVSSGDTTINVVDTSKFPNLGTFVARQVTLTQPTSTISGVSTASGVATYTTGITTGITAGQPIKVAGLTGIGSNLFNGTFIVNSITSSTNFTVLTANTLAVALTGQTATASWTTNSYSTTIEYMNYTGKTNTQFTGVTRGRAGLPSTAGTLTIPANTSVGTVSNATTLQIGMRMVGVDNAARLAIPENTFITGINGTTITLNNAITSANPSVYFIPMGTGSAQVFSNITGNPVEVELAYPTFSPAISHWGTSVIMDGRYDDDKSLLFTYGQQQQTPLGSASGYYYITSVSNTGTTVTYTTADTSGLLAGAPIAIANVAAASSGNYNGNFIISSVNPNASFTVTNSATGGSPVTGNASFGIPATTQYAGTGASNAITFPNLNTAVIGQTIAGDTTRFPLNTPNRITAITTSQPNQITSIVSQSATQTVTGAVPGTTGALTLTSIVGNGTIAIATLAAPSNTIYPGAIVQVAGGTGTSFTGSYTVQAVTSTTIFTFAATPNGTQTGGTATTNTGIVTYTVGSTSGIYVGQPITIAGDAIAGYNGTFLVNTIASSTTFTVLNGTTGTSSGTRTAIVNTATYFTAGVDGTVANRFVTIQGATTSGYNGTFLTVQGQQASATVGTYFTVVTSGLVTGQSSTAQAIVYSGLLLQNIGGAGAHNQFASLYGANTKALFSIRIAPSVDNGIPASLGNRELINRMQLQLRSLGITTSVPATGNPPVNILVTAVLNGVPNTTTAWTSVTRNQVGVANSSLSMIADYAGSNTIVSGGENTGGFLTDGTQTLALDAVRDLGNSILGGGGTTSNTNVFPDGPDTLTIVATNLSPTPLFVSGRLSWSEAQA